MTRYDDLVAMVEVHDGEGSCLLWPFETNHAGYGRLRVNGRKESAHRLALALVEPEPEGGAFALHSCDNPLCVSPAHLRWGSHDDNMADKVARGRAAIQSGEANGRAKLSEAEVLEIRRLAAEGVRSQRDIAAAFGVDQSTVSDIHRRKRWAHLGDDV